MNIAELKRQLNIEQDFVDDDIILQMDLDVAEQACLNYLNLWTGSTSGVTGGTRPVSISQAVLLLASHFYVTRQPVSYGQAYKIPLALEFLLDSYKNFTIS
jgi:hypothetical protein